MKRLKWMAGASALLALLVIAPVHGKGGRWSGIDPEVRVNNDTINVWIEWPEDQTCLIDGLIDVDIWHPKKADVQLISESYDVFPCDTAKDGYIHALTKTNLKDGTESDPNKGGILVAAKVNTSEQMPVNVKVYRNGKLIQLCEGFSDEFVFCEPYQLD